MSVRDLRRKYHRQINEQMVRFKTNKKSGLQYPNFADGDSRASREIAGGIVKRLKTIDQGNREPLISVQVHLLGGKNGQDSDGIQVKSGPSMLVSSWK